MAPGTIDGTMFETGDQILISGTTSGTTCGSYVIQVDPGDTSSTLTIHKSAQPGISTLVHKRTVEGVTPESRQGVMKELMWEGLSFALSHALGEGDFADAMSLVLTMLRYSIWLAPMFMAMIKGNMPNIKSLLPQLLLELA